MDVSKGMRTASTLLLMIVLTAALYFLCNVPGAVSQPAACDNAKILEPPVPTDPRVVVHGNITFSCKGEGAIVKWAFNDSFIVMSNYSITYETVSDCIMRQNLTVLASTKNNNTKIVCYVYRGSKVDWSDPVHLTVIGPPLPPDPVLNVVSVSTIQVSWTEPYSSPGYDILNYKIEVKNLNNGDQIYDTKYVNHTEYNFYRNSTNIVSESCMALTIFLSAVNSAGESEAATITGGFPIAPGLFTSQIDVKVNFQSDGTPEVTITFQLPNLCHHQDVYYTITLYSLAMNDIVIGPKRYSHVDQNWPFVHEVIQSHLEVNTAYSVGVAVSTPGVDTSYSNESSVTKSTFFVTNFNPTDSHTQDNQNSVRIAAAVGSSFAILLVVATIVIVIVIIRKHRHDDQKHSNEKARSAMVPNPIYEGPLYEIISPQNFDPLAANIESDSDQVQELRYLDNPILPARADTSVIPVTDNALSPTPGDDNYTVMSPIVSQGATSNVINKTDN